MTKKFTVEIPKELHAAIKFLSAMEDESMNKIITEAIKEKVEEAVKEGKLPQKFYGN